MYCFPVQAALKNEDGEEEEIGQLENLRRTPRTKAEGDVRKSRRYSTGVMPGRQGKQNSAFLDKINACPAEEYSQRKTKLKE